MANATPDAVVAAARDLLADGLSRKTAADRLMADFGISSATAYRHVATARLQLPLADGQSLDLAEEALLTLHRAMLSAEAEGDWPVAAERAASLASAIGKLKISRIVG
jgi:hypothetical protein